MINKIKAQMYQAVRENATYLVFLVMLMIYVLLDVMSFADEGSSDLSGSSFFVKSASGIPFILNMLTLIYTARTCGGDIIDRTMNYELLDGAKRSDVFFSRFLVSLFWSLTTSLLIVVLPLAAMAAYAGWGNMLPVAGAARRIALLAVPVIKMTALYTLLTFAVMDFRAVIAIGFLLGQAEMIAYMLIDESGALGIDPRVFALFSMTAISRLYDVSNFTVGYINGEDVSIVKDTMSASDNVLCIGICAVMTVIYISVGYAVFRRRDIK